MSSKSVQEILESAKSQGQISAEAVASIEEALDDIAIAGARGRDIEELDSEEVTLVSVVIDASGSMTEHRNKVIKSYNEQFLKPLQGAKNAKDIWVEVWVFQGVGPADQYCQLIQGWTPVPDCQSLTSKNYQPMGGTPLFAAVHRAQTGMVAYGQVCRDSGTRTKCIMVVISDGQENMSEDLKISGTMVRTISESMLKQENYVLSYIFFGRESEGDKHAEQIGFPPQHRLTGTLTDSEIRRIFQQVSSSVISTSQTSVSTTSLSANAFFSPQARFPGGR